MTQDNPVQEFDIKVNYTADIYRWYVQEQLKANPSYYTAYDKLLSIKGILLLLKRGKKNEEIIVMSYTIFRSIIEKCNKLIVQTLIKGEPFYFGKSLGHIQGSRIERNFSKKRMNYAETNKLRKETGDLNVIVYHTSDSYCRIAWKKVQTLRNSSIYELKPAKGFRASFSEALVKDPLLQYAFQYFKQ